MRALGRGVEGKVEEVQEVTEERWTWAYPVLIVALGWVAMWVVFV